MLFSQHAERDPELLPIRYGRMSASPERNLTFDLRDFDETLPGPFEWDLKRPASLAGRDRQEVSAQIKRQATLRTSAGAFQKMTEIRDGRRHVIRRTDPPRPRRSGRRRAKGDVETVPGW